MTDNELILAISNMLDPIREDIQDIREEIRDIRKDIQDIRGDIQNLEEDIQDIRGDIQNLEENIQDIRKDIQDIKGRVKSIELTQENEILPRLNTIEACYTSTYDRYKDNVDTYEIIKQDISVLKKVALDHSEKLQKLA
ncbi:MAG: hypothetical protein NC429_16140 [Lachnospiraceae bacterium]|nr:hypothetical protein [Lachnospiraceae bacterium]